MSRSMRSEASSLHASEPVVSMITWLPQGRERRLSLWVDERSQGGRCFNAGTSVARDNRLATSVQTHFFDSGSAAAVGRQERWTQRLFVWLAKGGRNGGELREQRLREESAQVVRSIALGRRPTRGGESARTRWSCGGARPPNFQDRRCTGLFEQQVPVKSVFAQTR